MAENDWKKLKEVLSDYSAPEPEGLWEGIEKGLSAAPKKASLIPWGWAATGLAAAAAAALVLFLPGREEKIEVEQGDPIAVVTQTDETDSPEETVPETVENTLETHSETVYRPSTLPSFRHTTIVPVVPDKAEETIKTEEQPEHTDTGSPVETVEETVTETLQETVTSEKHETHTDEEKPLDFQDIPFIPQPPVKKVSRPLLIGAWSGGVSQSGAYQRTGFGMPKGISCASDAGNDGSYNRLVRMMVTNQKTSSTVQHGAPVRVGISLGWQITPGWRLESGLVLSHLSSTFITDSGGIRSVTDQKLQYLGIPFTASYRLPIGNRVGLYAGGGMMAEYGIKATANTSSYLSGNRVEYEKEVFDPGGLLWSVNAHLGIEAGITDQIGIYLEPGTGYHFNNGSDVESAYTHRPLDFHVTVGLRLKMN